MKFNQEEMKQFEDELIYFKTLVKYQDQYIRQLEAEIYNITGEKQLELVRAENDPSIEVSVFLRSKFTALYTAAYSLQKKLDQVFKSVPETPLEADSPIDSPPKDYTLRRRADIRIHPLGTFHKQILLRWKMGEKEMGNALCIDDAMPLNMETLGYLIEKFFYDVCNSKIKLLKGQEIGK